MRQILFVLRGGQIAFWKMTNRGLVRGTLRGERWTDYTSEYWSEWAEATQNTDEVDAILLVESSAKISALPHWLEEVNATPSAWTLDQLAELEDDVEFEDKGLVLSQRKAKFTLVAGDPVETYSLLSSCKFTLPRSVPAKPVAKPPLSGIIGDSYNDPEALKLSVGDELKGTIVKIFNAMKRSYVKVEGLKEQVCFKAAGPAKFTNGDKVALMVTKVDVDAKTVLFTVVKHS